MARFDLWRRSEPRGETRQESPELAQAGFLCSVWLFGFAAFLFLASEASFPYTVVRRSTGRVIANWLVFPQGWAFFTRDPREDQIRIYREGASGAWESASLGPSSDPRNLFGWSRAPRAQAIEFARLLQRAGTKDWNDCPGEGGVQSCLDHVPVQAEIDNDSPSPTLCGPIGFIRAEPIPWAWLRHRSTIRMPRHAVRLFASCSER